MIIGIGTDLVEIKRVEKACNNQAFFTRCFSVNEQGIIKNNMSKAAGNWAVKESVGKCFGTGISGFELNDVEVLRDEKGKPYVILKGAALTLATKFKIDIFHVSITNTDEYAMAYVIAERISKE